MSEISEYSYEHPSNVRLMLDLGILHATDEDFTAYERWGKLIDDKVLRERKFAYTREHLAETKGNVVSAKFIIAQMSKAERVALRDRVLGVVAMPRGKNV